MQYKAAISYSHKDEAWARWLHRRLERYRFPKKLRGLNGAPPMRLGRVFRDRDELGSAADLSQTLKDALRNAEYLIVVCSEHAVASRWVAEEVRTFLALGRADRILCCIVGGEPPAVFPEPLQDAEPLAADLRPDGDGRTNGFLKLVAGLSDVPFDDLRQREAVARQRRMLWVTGASLAGMALASALALAAFLGQREAARQARVANEVSNFLVDLFEISDPGNARGATVTARELLEAGSRRIESELEEQPAIRARLLATLARVYANLGFYDQAFSMQTDALDQLADVGAGDAERGRSLAAKGELLNLLADHERAQVALVDARGLLERAEGRTTEDYAGATTSLALANVMLGDVDTGETLYREALALRETLFGADHPDVAQSLTHLGWLLNERGRHGEARALLSRALDIRERTLGADHYLVAESLDLLGDVQLTAGEFADAQRMIERALAVKQTVLGVDHPSTGRSYIALSNALRLQGDLDAAQKTLATGIETLTEALGAKHLDVAQALHSAQGLHAVRGEWTEVRAMRERILEIYEASLGPSHEFVGRALNDLGAVLTENLGMHAEAEPILRRAVDVLDAASAVPGWRGLARWTLANCLRESGNVESARARYQEAIALFEQIDQNDATLPSIDALYADYARLPEK